MSSERTSVFEMRRIAGRRVDDAKITPAAVDAHPERDIDRLTAALESAETVSEVAVALDTTWQDVMQWADIYGLDYEALLVGEGSE